MGEHSGTPDAVQKRNMIKHIQMYCLQFTSKRFYFENV